MLQKIKKQLISTLSPNLFKKVHNTNAKKGQ